MSAGADMGGKVRTGGDLREQSISPAPPSGIGPASGSPWLDHAYGPRVHLLDCPWTNSALAKLSSPDCTHTELVQIVRAVTARLATEAYGRELPRSPRVQTTRMAEHHGDIGRWRGDALDPAMRVIVLDVIRGGIIPGQTCFELLSLVHPIEHLRLDHLSMERVAGQDGRVRRIDLSGAKIGGSTEGATVVIPDPMGATGSTMRRAYDYLVENFGRPARVISLQLIATPEFLRTVLDLDPSLQVYAGRLDRGMSDLDVLNSKPGSHWDRESGLDACDYIVPGAGGVGELLNNSWT